MTNYQIIKQLNELFEEAIVNYPEEDILTNTNELNDPAFDRNLKFIRKLNTKVKAELQKNWWGSAKAEIDRLFQEMGKSNLIGQLLQKPQYQELGTLFSKFEQVSEEDKASMVTDKKMLELLRQLKKEADNETNSDE